MKLCSVCQKSDLLCSGCSKKLERGEITETDVKISRSLAKLDVEAEYFKVVEDDRSIIIITDKDHTRSMIGRGGKVTRQLSVDLGKEVRVIEKADDKQMIEKVIRSQVIGINVLYGNGEKYRIRMQRTRQRVSTIILSAILGKNVEVVFE